LDSISIFTDSTADIPEDLRGALGITVVPLSVTIGEETFPDGTLSQADFFARMNAAPRLPTTSQPSVGAFREGYERALATAAEVVSIHISPKLSGTVESAREAAAEFEGRVRVVDSHTLSGALGLQVVRAARDAARGLTAAEIVTAVEAARDDFQLIVGVDKLDNLAKGGRIGKVTAFLGGMLNMRVTFFVRDGEFIPLHRARGAHAVLDQTVEWIGERMGDRTRGVLCVLHAMAADKAEWLRGAIEERFEVTEMHVWEVGTVISTHTGTAFGVAFLPVD
jgi:DegV family protein with EDD domain